MRMTKAAFARHRGVTGAAVTKMIKTGRIVVGDDNRIHVEAANNMLDGPVEQEPAPTNTDGSPDIDIERARKMKADADLAELKVKEAEGRLIPIEVIKAADFQTIRTWRDTLLGVADRLSAKCAATTDERKVNAIIMQEIRATLEAMANGVDYGRAGDKVES